MNAAAPDPGRHDTLRTRGARAVGSAALLITPCLFSFDLVSFSDAKLAGLAVAVLALAVLVPCGRDSVRLLFNRFGPLLIWVGLALGLALLSYPGAAARQPVRFIGGVTLVPPFAFAAAASFALVLLAAVLLHAAFGPNGQRRLLAALAASGVPVAALGLVQYAGLADALFPVFPDYDQRMYSVFGNQDLFGGYLAVSLALWLALALSDAPLRRFAWPAILVLLPALLLSGSRSAWLAAAAGCALAVYPHRPRPRPLALAAAVAIALMLTTVALAPRATLDRVANSFSSADTGYRVRLWIWDGAARMVPDHAALGVGLGNFQYHSPKYLGTAIYARGPGGHYFNRVQTLHAHSDFLEVLTETGLAGAALVVAFLLRLPRVMSPAWAGLAAQLTFSLFNTTLHSPPHVLTVLVCASALPLAPDRDRARDPRRIRIARAVPVAAAVAVGAAVAWTTLVPSFLLARAQNTVERSGADEIQATYRAAMRAPGSAYEASRALAILKANAGHLEEADRLIGIALLGLDTGDVHYLAGNVAERRGDAPRAAAEYEASILRWPDHVRAWEGWLAVAAESDRDRLLQRALPWLGPAAADRLATFREELRSASIPPTPAATPEV